MMSTTKLFRFVLLALFCFPVSALAWEGTKEETGETVEIEQGTLVRSGRDIDVYNGDTGEYENVSGEDINRYGSTVELEVYNNDTGEYETLEMSDDDYEDDYEEDDDAGYDEDESP